MTDESELGVGHGPLPAAPPPVVSTGLERQLRKAVLGQGELMGDVAEAPGLRDALTGALSRASLHDRLRQEVDRARRYGLPLSILVIVLDNF